MRAETATVTASALAAALGGEPGPGFFRALAKTPQEAADLASRLRSERKWQSALARHGFDP